MTYSNTIPAVSQTTASWNGSYPISYANIPLLADIPHDAQLTVSRVFTTAIPAASSDTLAVFLNAPQVSALAKRQVFIIPNARIQFEPITKHILSINLPNEGGNIYQYTAGGITIGVPPVISGQTIIVERKTVSNLPLITWVPGAKLTSLQLNRAITQSLYLTQEILSLIENKIAYDGTPLSYIANSSILAHHIASGVINNTHISASTWPWVFTGTASVTGAMSLGGALTLNNVANDQILATNGSHVVVGKATTGTTSVVLADTPTLVSPHLGTPLTLVGTNISGTNTNGFVAASSVTIPNLTGDITSAGVATQIAAGAIVDSDINASAAIADTKLGTIATAGKVANTATTASSSNTNNAIVARDGSGNFAAATMTGNVTGNLTGNVTGNLSGTVTQAAQSQITSVGTLSSLTSTGNLTTSGLLIVNGTDLAGSYFAGNVTIAGTLTANNPGVGAQIDEFIVDTVMTLGASETAFTGYIADNVLTVTNVPNNAQYLSVGGEILPVSSPTSGFPNGVKIVSFGLGTTGQNGTYTLNQAGDFDWYSSGSPGNLLGHGRADNTDHDGGIVLMGTTNKTLRWNNTKLLWEFSHSTGVKTGNVIKFDGTSSGAISLNSTIATGTWDLLLPPLAASDTLVAAATTQTLTNKTILAGTGATNSISIHGVAAVTNTGTGTTLVRSEAPTINNPTLTNFNLGTPLSGNLQNCGHLLVSGLYDLHANLYNFLLLPNAGNLHAALAAQERTGSGKVVFNDTPTLVSPHLGSVASGNLTGLAANQFPTLNQNTTGTAASLSTALTGVVALASSGSTTTFGTGFTASAVHTALDTGDKTGTGKVVFATSPALTTPDLGIPSGGSLVSCTNYPAASLTGTVPVTKGGTGLALTTTQGGMLYANAASASALTQLAIGASGYVLTSNGSIPTWAAPVSGGSSGNRTGFVQNSSGTTLAQSFDFASLDTIVYYCESCTNNQGLLSVSCPPGKTVTLRVFIFNPSGGIQIGTGKLAITPIGSPSALSSYYLSYPNEVQVNEGADSNTTFNYVTTTIGPSTYRHAEISITVTPNSALAFVKISTL